MICAVVLVLAILVAYKVVDYLIRSVKVEGLSNKYVFITGCDTGFGHDLALYLDQLGFNVFAGCFSEDGQRSLADNASSRLMTLPLDVANSESICNALEFVKEKLPHNTGLWAIVNNAGVTGVAGPVEICTQEDFHKTLAVNLLGPIEICRTFLPLIRKSKGRIVNMVSAMGRIVGEAPPYAVSKFGMEAFSDGLRRDLYGLGVKVSIIEPGFFRTHVVDKVSLDKTLIDAFNAADDEIRNAYGGERYLKRCLRMFGGTRKFASKDLSLVVKAYTHAITSCYPRTRYVVGWDAKLLFVPLSMIPTGITDWLIHTVNK